MPSWHPLDNATASGISRDHKTLIETKGCIRATSQRLYSVIPDKPRERRDPGSIRQAHERLPNGSRLKAGMTGEYAEAEADAGALRRERTQPFFGSRLPPLIFWQVPAGT